MSEEKLCNIVKNDRFEMEYIRFGHGSKVLVIIPGVSLKPMALSAEAVRDGFWSFTDEYTVFLFDRISDMKPGYLVPDMAEDTVMAMKQLGIEKADIFATSQGSMIAQVIGAEYPDLVGKMVLGGTLLKNSAFSTGVFTDWVEMCKAADRDGVPERLFGRIYSKEFYEMFRAAFVEQGQGLTDEEFARFQILAEACRAYDGSSYVPRITAPLYVMYGGKDEVLGHDAAMKVVQATGCEYYVYPEGSHAVYDEAPDFRAKMLAFLQK